MGEVGEGQDEDGETTGRQVNCMYGHCRNETRVCFELLKSQVPTEDRSDNSDRQDRRRLFSARPPGISGHNQTHQASQRHAVLLMHRVTVAVAVVTTLGFPVFQPWEIYRWWW